MRPNTSKVNKRQTTSVRFNNNEFTKTFSSNSEYIFNFAFNSSTKKLHPITEKLITKRSAYTATKKVKSSIMLIKNQTIHWLSLPNPVANTDNLACVNKLNKTLPHRRKGIVTSIKNNMVEILVL